MECRLDYGRDGLTVCVPDNFRITRVEPAKGVPLADPSRALEVALEAPIGARPLIDCARGKRTAVVVISDKTRPVPNGLVLPPILRRLAEAGISREDVEIIVATG